MKKQVIIYIVTGFISLMLSGCNNRPDGILDTESMADILYEIHVTEAVTRCGFEKARNEYVFNNILESHGVTPAQFDSCIAWYTKHPDEYLEVYIIIQQRFPEEKKNIVGY